ncbi:MAG: hypothetical protein K0R93_721 [Anaerosolibacter sp.]|jgi:hypothetical protein|uniref:hypothetical protein n=1 Tax=Anaerosolibacter sp. TaxID=1872527 RepID=UPI002609BEFD|nr:hypothetical protein [Anaerosolibacter sp.]MDF2545823.1 hypothetical protein [Anaerosolibacter sp.]
MQNTVWKQIIKWFVKKVWPLIQKLLIEFIVSVVKWIFDKIREILITRSERWTQNAEEKARSAEESANRTTDEQEREKYKREAEIWRKVADDYRCENENLKSEISDFKEFAKSTIKEKVNDLKVDDVFNTERDIRLKEYNFSNSLPLITSSQNTSDLQNTEDKDENDEVAKLKAELESIRKELEEQRNLTNVWRNTVNQIQAENEELKEKLSSVRKVFNE